MRIPTKKMFVPSVIMKKLNATRPNGFTLVELLVVIVIIITLAALSLSVMSRMRAAGDGAATAVSLRQLQTANVTYALEHAGRYASYSITDSSGNIVRWYKSPTFLSYFTANPNLLLPTTADPTVQANLLDPTVVRAKKRWWDKVEASYGMNHEWIVSSPPDAEGTVEKYTTVIAVKNPGRTAAFITATDGAAKYNGRKLWVGAAAVEGKTTDGKMAFRHENKALVVYYDGRVDTINMRDIIRFDNLGGSSNVFWSGK